MNIDYSNAVRVLAAADQQTVVQFCNESGTIDDILGFRDSGGEGDSILFVRFKKLSSVLDLRRRSKIVKLGGRPILVDSLVGSPVLQEQCRALCSSLSTPYRVRRMSLFSGRQGEKENFDLDRPSSAPASKPISAYPGLVKTEENFFRPLRRAHSVRQPTVPRSLNCKATSGDSTSTTIAGLPSPLAKSPTVLRTSVRTNILRGPHTPTTSSPLLRSLSATSRRTQPLLNPGYSFSRRLEADASGLNVENQKNHLRWDIENIRRDLDEAKEAYVRSLEKVKGQLKLMEKRYRNL